MKTAAQLDQGFRGFMSMQAKRRRRVKPTEDQFRASVVATAEWCGWRAYAIRRSDLAQVCSQTGAGYPDLTLARRGELLIVELKRDRDTRTPAQHAWADELPPDQYRLWTPADWPEIERELAGSGRRGR